MLCFWRNTHIHVAQRAVHSCRAVQLSAFGATREPMLRNAQCNPVFLYFLMSMAQRASLCCATRRVFGQG
ncbi:hypothetical protein A2U01_0084748 [Trifolium medium]|uniref:Uncharacterized protein n=1 Tax=Trifolium medium TaxID=97028 RepID=A0A392TQR0_9FABA|nr:hypothetical protein [Trifolium medium]